MQGVTIDRAEAERLHDDGLSYPQIARRLGVSRSGVGGVLKGRVRVEPGSGPHCWELADGDPLRALELGVLAFRMKNGTNGRLHEDDLHRLREAGDVGPTGETVPQVAGDQPRQPGKFEEQVCDLVDAARELDEAIGAHWPALRDAIHHWENLAAHLPGVALTHGVLAQLEPELAEQLGAPKPARRKR